MGMFTDGTYVLVRMAAPLHVLHGHITVLYFTFLSIVTEYCNPVLRYPNTVRTSYTSRT